jgi:hypothetical protein
MLISELIPGHNLSLVRLKADLCVFVDKNEGRLLHIEIEARDTVLDLKDAVMDKEGVPV